MQGTALTGSRLPILVGICLAASFAAVGLIQSMTNEDEAWDSSAFWPVVLLGSVLLGVAFVRSARSAVLVGGTFAASILVASFALSRDDQGANVGLLTILFLGPWLALVIGCAAMLGGYAFLRLTARAPSER